MKKISYNKVDPNKGVVSFTWDDNSDSHFKYIAPIFEQHGYRCTFYINPGEELFKEKYEKGYTQLAKKSFEIGSHGYTHHHYSKLSNEEFNQQLENSRIAILSMFSKQPTTFAFPHHDFDKSMLYNAKQLFFETRNTLENSNRFSLKSTTQLECIDEALQNAKIFDYTVIFSGHGILDPVQPSGKNGYEPITEKILYDILDLIKRYNCFQILTFEQAAMFTYIQSHCKTDGSSVSLESSHIMYLENYGYTIERIAELL